MEKYVDPEVLKLYISQRDGILKVIAEDVCCGCTEPQKDKIKLIIKIP